MTKSELYRVVKNLQGVVEFDASGKKEGRGAYVCSIECLSKSIETKRFERALKTPIKDDCLKAILREVQLY